MIVSRAMRKFISSVLLVFLANPAFGAAPLSLEEVLDVVRAKYPPLQAETRNQERARGEFLSTEGGFDPLVRGTGLTRPMGYYQNRLLDVTLEQPTGLWGTRFFGGYRKSDGDFPVYEGKFETNRGGEFRFGLEVPLWRNGPIDNRRAQVRRAEAGVGVADQSYLNQRLAAVRQATQKYWDWAGSGLRLQIAKDLLKIAIDRDSQISLRVSKGDLPAIERVDNQRAIAERQSQLVAAERLLQRSALELALFLRDNDGNPVVASNERLPTEIPGPIERRFNIDNEVQEAAQRNPEVKGLRLSRRQFEIEEQFNSNQTMPRVDVQLAASKDLGTGSSTRERPELEAQLVLEIPLLARTPEGRSDAARASMLRTDALEKMALDRIRTGVIDAIQQIHATTERVSLAKQEVSFAQRMETAERRRFLGGDSNLLMVNLREQQTAQARQREVDSLIEHHKAVADYQAISALGL